jgi:SHS family lactate transporter-like MFS transporter
LNLFPQLRGMTGHQWRAFIAAYLGWTLDAFDYFLLVMVIGHVAADFHAEVKAVSLACSPTASAGGRP